MPFPSLTKSARRRFAFILVLIAAVAGIVWKWPEIQERLFPPDPLVATPRLACEQLQARSLYFNGIALPWLEKFRPDLLTAEDRDPASPRRRAFVQATQSP
ncbi:MAG: hypothetical protein ABI318_06050, partial [Chthoniobacteraceae bacterium]